MQVGASTVSCVPRHAKLLPGIHYIALFHDHTIQMTIGHAPFGSVSTVVLHHGIVAAGLVATDRHHAALVLRGQHILILRPKVNAVMSMAPITGRRKAEAIGHDHVLPCERKGIALSRC